MRGNRPPNTPVPPPLHREAPALLPPPAPAPHPREGAHGRLLRGGHGHGRPGAPIVALAITGSIAAYKAVEIARHLVRAGARGAQVTLIAGPVELPTPFGLRRVDVRSTLAMKRALWEALGQELDLADALVMTAAVADYRPAEEHPVKRKRSAEPIALELVANPDLLAEVGAARRGRAPVLCGFAVETDTDEGVAREGARKLAAKRVDLIVANHARDSFGKDDDRATILSHEGAEALGTLPKTALADRILDRVAAIARR